MISEHQHPLTPDEVRALVRRAHAERSQAIRDFVLGLFRRKPASPRHEQPSLSPVTYG